MRRAAGERLVSLHGPSSPQSPSSFWPSYISTSKLSILNSRTASPVYQAESGISSSYVSIWKCFWNKLRVTNDPQMVSDGMGPTSLALTREWRQYTEQLPYDDTLLLDEHLIGQSRTRSSSSLVTDSAAGATAFSCGQKSYNGAISILPDHTPCGSVMEAAKRMGYTTGLVVTTRLTDATPAVFASHVRRREMEDEIATQMVGVDHPLGRMVDLMFGGGRCHFLPNGTDGSCRADDRDVIKEATGEGWNYIDSREDFDNLGSSAELPLMGLFAGGDVPYEIDRRFQDAQYPSLAESARSALEILSAATKDTEQGTRHHLTFSFDQHPM